MIRGRKLCREWVTLEGRCRPQWGRTLAEQLAHEKRDRSTVTA